jgi:hypothetical protein
MAPRRSGEPLGVIGFERRAAPLFVTVSEALREDYDWQTLVLHGAVHAWMEGHVATCRGPARSEEDEDERMPSPPFPDPGDVALRELVAETIACHSERTLTAAVFEACGRAFVLGAHEGEACTGGCGSRCSEPQAGMLRASAVEVVLHFELPARSG